MKTLSGATALSAAIGLAMAMQGTPAGAAGMQDDPQVMQQMMKFIKDKMQKEHLEMCYGINAEGKNDCGTSTHSCHGQAAQARDPESFVLVPTGVCTKIAGGRLKPA
jgi:uncharacterized membrane protein